MFLNTGRLLGYILIGLFVLLLFVHIIRVLFSPDYNDEYVVIRYSCKTALSNPGEYPPVVHKECDKLKQDNR